MATTGIINGHDLLVYITTTAISYSTTCSLTINIGTIPATSKDSKKWADNMIGCRDWSVETSGMVALDAAIGIEELYGYVNSQNSVNLKFATDDAADRFFSGTAFLTGLTIDAPDETPATYSASFVGTGKLKFAKT